MADYDVVVIGSGPAGEKAAVQAAFFGKRVALVEKGPLGGTVANTGTLPSKTLRETALFLSGFRKRELFGVDAGLKGDITVRDLLFREQRVRDGERARVRANLDRSGVRLLSGSAVLTDAHTVKVTREDGATEHLSAGTLLISTGSSPRRPSVYPFEHERIYDSDELLEMRTLPRSLAVIGAGVIGCEYACMFAALGIFVTLVERQDHLLGFLDDDVRTRLTAEMEALGIEIRYSEEVASAVPAQDGVTLTFRSGQSTKVDAVLVAAGRVGNTSELGLERAGVALNERGLVKVNAHFQTSVPHIYAAGDVIGSPALASTGMEQGRIAMCHAFDRRYKERLAPILPYGIYTIPEVSMAGETEASLKEKGIDFIAGVASFSENARGEIIGDRGGMLKLLFRASNLELVGVHVIGEHASELVHIGLTAMLMRATLGLFIDTCYNFPTLSGAYKSAADHALGQLARQDTAVLARAVGT